MTVVGGIRWDECSDPPALSCADADCPVHGWDQYPLDSDDDDSGQDSGQDDE